MAFNEEYEPFALIGAATASPHQVYDDYKNIYGHPVADTDVQLTSALQNQYPGYHLTVVPAPNCDLLGYAGAGYAKAELDLDSEGTIRWRGFLAPSLRGRESGIGEDIRFAKYNYTWLSEKFIVYVARVLPHADFNPTRVQYVLREQCQGEVELSPSIITDKLIKTVGEWQFNDKELVWVFDLYWIADKRLWRKVQEAKWEDVILDESMKKALRSLVGTFFDSEDVYRDLGVPWKRGVIFHGPAGNGKTITLKAIMHTLYTRELPIPTLYVKAAPRTYHISWIFEKARQVAPCLLVFEDIDTIVTEETRSYFFNEVDGLDSNDGIMMIASTNHLEKLDPGLSHRPSRFDRKYLFPLPDLSERTLYCNYWRHRILARSDSEGGGKLQIEFPEKLCPAMAAKMDRFSFAYMKEAFVATLLAMLKTGEDTEEDEGNKRKAGQCTCVKNSEERAWERDDEDGFDKYEIWAVFVEQVKILKKEVDDGAQTSALEPLVGLKPQVKDSANIGDRRFLSGRFDARRGLGKGLGGLPASDHSSEGGMGSGVDRITGVKWRPVTPLGYSQGRRL